MPSKDKEPEYVPDLSSLTLRIALLEHTVSAPIERLDQLEDSATVSPEAASVGDIGRDVV